MRNDDKTEEMKSEALYKKWCLNDIYMGYVVNLNKTFELLNQMLEHNADTNRQKF